MNYKKWQFIRRTITLCSTVLFLYSPLLKGQSSHPVKADTTESASISKLYGSSITTIDLKTLVESDEQNIAAALHGKVPNLEVMKHSGDAGTGTFLRFRGTRSILHDNQPLFVIDGVPFNNSMDGAHYGGIEVQNRAIDLNIHDIETVEFLPGASAATLYGSRGANGVILISTRSGTSGKPKIRFSSRIGTNSIPGSYPLQRSYGQGINGAFEQDNSRSWGESLDGVETYDHFGEITATGLQADNSLSISGGTGRGNYYFSAARFNETGPWQTGSDYWRHSFRLKGDYRIIDDLRISAGLSHIESDGNFIQRGENGSGLLISALRTPPEFNNLPYLDPENNLHRSYRYSEPTELIASRKFDNPFFVMNEHRNRVGVNRNFGFSKLNYSFNDQVNVSYLFGYDESDDMRTSIFPQSSQRQRYGRLETRNYTNMEKEGTLLIELNPQNTINQLTSNIKGKLIFGHSWNVRRNSYAFMRADTLGTGMPMTVKSSYEVFDETVTTTRINTESYFGSIDLQISDQLYVSAGLRGDASSLFADKDRFFWYPRIGGNWEFSKLDMISKIPALNSAILHASWGSAGIEPDPYSYIRKYTNQKIDAGYGKDLIIDETGYAGLKSSYERENSDARPEKVTEFEYGSSFSLLDSRVGFDITYYTAKTENAAVIENRSSASGFTTALTNNAAIENRGFELSVQAVPFKSRNIVWHIGAAIGKNDNKITSLGYEDDNGKYAVGQSVNSIMLDDFIRFGNGEIIENRYGQMIDIDKAYSEAPDGALYLREDGLPKMSRNSVWGGDYDYDWIGGISSSITLRNNLTIAALFDFRSGGKILNGTRGSLYSYGTHLDTGIRGSEQYFDGYGPGEGKSATLDEDWFRGYGNYFSGAETPFFEDAGYVKLRELSLSYLLNNEFIRKMRLESIQVRLSGRNLVTWTDYTGFDPETSVYQDGRLKDYYNQPQTRSFSLSINLIY